MSHIIILTLVLNLIAGTAVFLYTLSVYRRYRRTFLKTLLTYILSFNGLVIVYFVYQYFMINMLGNDPFRILDYQVLFSGLVVLVYCAEFGITFNLFRLLNHMRDRKISGAAKTLFALWLALFGAASAFGVDFFFRKMEWLVFYWIHAGWEFSMIIIILILLFLSFAASAGKRKDKNSLPSFALIFLFGYSGFAVSSLDFYFFHSGIQKFYDPLIILLITLCPILWLKLFFEKKNQATTEDLEDSLARFCSNFGISKRERDIIEQVLVGKSNKAIEKVLFISHNTVKNHLYSVFQKTGVGSRSELIHRITRFQDYGSS
jgi:DNA-binding CsgD family transcriptional regulator